MSTQLAHTPLDVAKIREDFPILAMEVRGKPLVYLDNAATSQKPRSVIHALTQYYERENGNIHRGVHYLSEKATELYDLTRETARRFFHARHAHEMIFTRGATEGINLVASSFAQGVLRGGDEILVSTMEHHSNIVPWQMACERTGAVLKVIPITDAGELDMGAYRALLSERTKLVSVAHISNALGTINPVAEIVRLAHEVGAAVFIDGAQSAPHAQVDLQAIDCDFFACSGHKMLGPTGASILYGKEAWLDKLPPYMGGGDMIDYVSFERTTYARLPSKFEAGTPSIGDVVAYRHAFEYLEQVGLDAVAAHEHELLAHATEQLRDIPGVRLIGTAAEKAGVLSFTMDCAHPHDIGTILDGFGIAIRAGHHCAQPLMRRYGVPATARASFYLYNTRDEVDRLVQGIHHVRSVFA
ncbi:MAG: cysteine desulfurase [Gemmatimonadaceae bacterium]|nr:cysteine desulfurase [Gemmatimonadaceae bacterium]